LERAKVSLEQLPNNFSVAQENIANSSTYDNWLKYFVVIKFKKILVLRELEQSLKQYIVDFYFPLSDSYDEGISFDSELEANKYFSKQVEQIKALIR